MIKQSTKTIALTGLLAMIGVGLMPTATQAGFTATTGSNTGAYYDIDTENPGLIGDYFVVDDGTFVDYVPDTPLDPQIGSDLERYGYALEAYVVGTDTAFVEYSGTYEIFYDVNNNDTWDMGSDLRVSGGTLTAKAYLDINTYAFEGLMTQTAGPENPAFADLSYGGNQVTFDGTWSPGTTTLGLQGDIRQEAAIPEPATMSLLGLGGLALLRRKRRKTA